MSDTERDDWDNLLKSNGWLRLKDYAVKEYRDLIDQHLAHAANDANDSIAANKIRQVIAAKQAVERLLAYPGEQLHKLEPPKAKEPIREFAGSRRGGL